MAKEIKINEKFQLALDAITSGQHIFITGCAGTGKSTLLAVLSLSLQKSKGEKMPPLLAPTGVAALNIGGRTVHSFFGFSNDITTDSVKKSNPRNPKLYQNLRRLVIDEASMLRSDLVDCIDLFLRKHGPKTGHKKPFGGVQMIFIGDLYQLPPIVSRAEMEAFSEKYSSPYFFSAKVFSQPEFIDQPLQIVELEHIYRQTDQHFISILNRVRSNQVNEQDLETLNKLLKPKAKKSHKKNTVYLTTTNKIADQINERQLVALPGKSHLFTASVSGNFTAEYYPTALNLKVKKNAQIMFLNNDPRRRWVNGSIGTITNIDNNKQRLQVHLPEKQKDIEVEQFLWELFEYETHANEIIPKVSGTFCQFPIRLAWALTIHKSQGKTFKRMILDISSGVFAPGQLYVALSRVSRLNDLSLIAPIKRHHIFTDPQIQYFYNQQPVFRSHAQVR